MGAALLLALVFLCVLWLSDRAPGWLQSCGGAALRVLLLLYPVAARDDCLSMLWCATVTVSLLRRRCGPRWRRSQCLSGTRVCFLDSERPREQPLLRMLGCRGFPRTGWRSRRGHACGRHARSCSAVAGCPCTTTISELWIDFSSNGACAYIRSSWVASKASPAAVDTPNPLLAPLLADYRPSVAGSLATSTCP